MNCNMFYAKPRIAISVLKQETTHHEQMLEESVGGCR